MAFETILGNETLKQRLTQSLSAGKTSHCYLITGPVGSGKRTLAKHLAAALAGHLRCKEAHVRTAGNQELFGLCKPLKPCPLPDQAYLGLAFD